MEHALAWVNRYVVERVEADIELGFFFPGAESRAVTERVRRPPGGRSGRLTQGEPGYPVIRRIEA